MSIPKTDLATWVKLGMKRRVGEGFVATGTQVRAGAKCGHDSRGAWMGVGCRPLSRVPVSYTHLTLPTILRV